jgi:hypothetical protein
MVPGQPRLSTVPAGDDEAPQKSRRSLTLWPSLVDATAVEAAVR